MATNYIRELGHELDERLRSLEKTWREEPGEACDEEFAAFTKWVKEKVLESYRNGLNAVSLRVDDAERKLTHPARVSRSKS